MLTRGGHRWVTVLITVLITAVGTAAYATLSLLRLHQFALSSWDNAIFEQAVKGYARPGAPIVDVKAPGGYNILGDHWSPIDALIAPFYRLFPHAATIVLAQVVLIGISIALVTWLALRVLGSGIGTLVAVLYVVSFGLQSAVVADFHEVAFAVPLLALAGSAHVDRRWAAVAGWSVPLVLVKEDLGVTVAAIGFVLCLAGDKRRGALLAVGGLVATVVTVLVLIPAFANGDTYAYTSALGGDRGIVATLADEPGRKLATLAITVGITGLAALLSPWVLVAVPTFAWRFAGDNEFYWGTDFHYSLVLMPIVFVAMIDAIHRRPRAGLLVVPAVIVSAINVWGSPLLDLARPATWDDPPRAATAREVVDAIPDGSSVETDIGLMKQLVADHTVYWTGTIGLGDDLPDPPRPEYVALDLGSGIGSPTDPLAYAEDRYGGAWTTLVDRDGYVLITRASR